MKFLAEWVGLAMHSSHDDTKSMVAIATACFELKHTHAAAE